MRAGSGEFAMRQRKQKAVGFTTCPVNGCVDAPAPMFCPRHWPMLSGLVRRQVVTEMKSVRGRGTGRITDAMRDVLEAAMREVTLGEVAEKLAASKKTALTLRSALGLAD